MYYKKNGHEIKKVAQYELMHWTIQTDALATYHKLQ